MQTHSWRITGNLWANRCASPSHACTFMRQEVGSLMLDGADVSPYTRLLRGRSLHGE